MELPQTSPNKPFHITFHERALNDVCRKIKKVYGLSDTDIALSDDAFFNIENHSNRHLRDPSWDESCNLALSLSPECEASKSSINLVAKEIMLDYVKALHVCAQIRNTHGEGFYHREDSRVQMAKILTNHVSNLAEAKLRHLGLSPASAHALHGKLIGYSIRTADIVMPSTLHSVCPQQGRLIGCAAAEIEERIEELKNYGKHTAKALENAYKQDILEQPCAAASR